jgi:hypothetical protein
MKVFCKRTFIQDECILFKKNNTYDTQSVRDHEKEFFVHIKVLSEKQIFMPLMRKTFDKYFSTIQEVRDNRINQIINDNNINR